MLEAYRFILSAAPDSLTSALEEVQFKPYNIVSEVLAPGVALFEIEQPFDAWRVALEEKPPVFVRHLMPVQREVVLDKSVSDLERLTRVAVNLAEHLTPQQSFAVQTRLLTNQELPYNRFQVNQSLSNAIEAATGAPLNVRDPFDALSVVLTDERAYLGVSPVTFNRSAWAGGEHRFAREKDQISRAEFKLLEAQAIFDFQWPNYGIALDLGSAPGGWTRMLRQAGFPVVAVDPADMHPRFANDPKVIHERMLAQDFLPTNEEFSVIVNDIRMDARDAAFLMKDAASALEPGGLAVLTLKLPHDNFTPITYRALGILRSAYSIIGARQLFHNRSEVTVVMQKL